MAVQNIKTHKELSEMTDAWDAYNQWEKDSANRSFEASMEALENHPKRDDIKRAHDIRHLWGWWTYNLRNKVKPSRLAAMKPPIHWKGWNDWDKIQCKWIKRVLRNPWGPNSCIIPDWRSPEMVAEDEAFLAKQKTVK